MFIGTNAILTKKNSKINFKVLLSLKKSYLYNKNNNNHACSILYLLLSGKTTAFYPHFR